MEELQPEKAIGLRSRGVVGSWGRSQERKRPVTIRGGCRGEKRGTIEREKTKKLSRRKRRLGFKRVSATFDRRGKLKATLWGKNQQHSRRDSKMRSQ